jgi:hypothetical protein
MLLAALALAASAIVSSAGDAFAATCPDNQSGCAYAGWFAVKGTDGTLSVQSVDAVNHVIGSISEGDNIYVFCQNNSGSTDPYDGLSSHTWDEIQYFSGGAWHWGWVYDWFVSTPVQDSGGWSLTEQC